MAVTRRVESISRPAAADLSTNQFRIVFVDDIGDIALNTSNATASLGVLMNKPAGSGIAAEVAIVGSVVKCTAGAAVNERDAIRAVAGGHGSATTTNNDFIVGWALTAAAASGDLFELSVNPDRFNA